MDGAASNTAPDSKACDWQSRVAVCCRIKPIGCGVGNGEAAEGYLTNVTSNNCVLQGVAKLEGP